MVNAGGVIYLEGAVNGLSADEVDERLVGVGDVLRRVFATAVEREITPLAAAEAIAWERIDAARA